MEQKRTRPMTPFDCIVTPSYLHTLKLMLPYTPPPMQRFLAVFIKFLEFRYTMESFRGFPNHTDSSGISPGILGDLKPYMEPAEQEMMEQMESMMNMMEMIQTLQSMSTESDGNPMDLLKGMMSSEQQEMFHMYSNMFDQEMNPSETDEKKGDTEHERMDE